MMSAIDEGRFNNLSESETKTAVNVASTAKWARDISNTKANSCKTQKVKTKQTQETATGNKKING